MVVVVKIIICLDGHQKGPESRQEGQDSPDDHLDGPKFDPNGNRHGILHFFDYSYDLLTMNQLCD